MKVAVLSSTTTTFLLVTVTLSLLSSQAMSYPSSRKLRERGSGRRGGAQHGSKTPQLQNFFHSYINNGEVVKIHIMKHVFPGPQGRTVWYKRVHVQGKKPVTYTRKSKSAQWVLLPKKSQIPALDKQSKKMRALGECSEGWKIGKVVARTITYFALNQDKLRALLDSRMSRAGRSARNASPEANRPAKDSSTVDLQKVTNQIKAVIESTALCFRKGLMLDNSSTKEKCIHKAIMKEARILIEKIKEKAQKHGFICSYAALKEGECQLSKLDEIIERKEYA